MTQLSIDGKTATPEFLTAMTKGEAAELKEPWLLMRSGSLYGTSRPMRKIETM
jgi:hypothetical protein